MKAKKATILGLIALPTNFIFYYEFLHVIVHKSGLNFFGKGMSNKATQGQVPGLAGLYGLWKQDIFFVMNSILKVKFLRLQLKFCCNWSIGSREKQLFVTEFFAEIFRWFLSTTVLSF